MPRSSCIPPRLVVRFWKIIHHRSTGMWRTLEDFIKVMDESMVQLCNRARIVDDKCRDYGCGIEMSAREIHALEITCNHPHRNTTELAELAGLQKGTFSKMVRRLETWGLVERYQEADDRKQVFFRPTPLGERAYQWHYAFHERTSPDTYDYFHHYTEEEQASILTFIRHYTQYLKEYL